MIEGIQPQPGEAFGMPKSPQPEASVLDSNEQVLNALRYNLSGVALERWMALISNMQKIPSATIEKWIEDFNATSSEERGAGRYDHSRTGDSQEHKDISISRQTISGFPFSVTLHKNGEVTLASELA